MGKDLEGNGDGSDGSCGGDGAGDGDSDNAGGDGVGGAGEVVVVAYFEGMPKHSPVG